MKANWMEGLAPINVSRLKLSPTAPKNISIYYITSFYDIMLPYVGNM